MHLAEFSLFLRISLDVNILLVFLKAGTKTIKDGHQSSYKQ